MANIQSVIIDWYLENKRDLPWRDTQDPYKIWLSEIILQQTRVNQGSSYYTRFIDRYPTLDDLAHADEQSILNLWQGLGYYSRARNLHYTAKYIVNNLEGKFPSSFNELIKLKGIGEYTAAAIASFAFKEAVAAVDGNVYRVLSRVFDINIPINSSEGKRTFFALAQSLIDQKQPDTFNQAMMEFGALKCTPVQPDCENCPLVFNCLAFANKTLKERPVKSKKGITRNRYFHYLIFEKDGKTYIQQRIEKDIWQNLYQFPLVETMEKEEEINWVNFSDVAPTHISSQIIHILSHQKIHAQFYHFSSRPNKSILCEEIDYSAIQDYPLPRLIDRYLKEKN
jgi:A/G-specific adenine glycosylase